MTANGWSQLARLSNTACNISGHVRGLLLVVSFASGLLFGQVARAVGLL